MQRTNEMKIEFASNSVNEGFARVAVSAFFSQLDPTVDELYDLKMAVSEAVTNCIIHGYEGNVEGKVVIHCQYVDRTAMIEISDEGKGISDVHEAMTPLYSSSGDDERAGLGFTVMQSMMDEIDVTSQIGQGTTVKMTKCFD
jgi:stage II sporulation protein AB (anti-sigma F factor)